MKLHLLSANYQPNKPYCGTTTNVVWNAADGWDDATLPASMKPYRIYIYYADNADTPHIYFENGSVKYINLPADVGLG